MNEVGTKEKKVFYKTWYGITLIVICLIFVLSNLGGDVDKASTVAPTTQEVATANEPSISKEQAQKDLDSFMPTAKKAGLVTSYDFSLIAENLYRWDIFVGKTWYTQTVQQKKDFIAYIGLRKKAITGYTHFELHDAYTNEKVAEITSFSQSIEVYK